MARRGKQGDERYRSLSGRIPADLRADFKRKLADYDLDMTIDIFLERCVRLWVNGDIEIGTPNPPKTPVISEHYEPEHVTRARLAGLYTPEQRAAVWHLGDNETAPPEPSQHPKQKKQGGKRTGLVTFTDKTELGRLRKQLGYSQAQIASALNVAKSTAQRYESGKVRTPEHLLDIVRKLVNNDDSKND